jgi:spermidine synthase
VRAGLVSLILFLSGCSALLFQTLWLRLSGLAFGNSVWAAALILSSFMAGLALGNAIAALSTLPAIRPLRLYAGLESIVAVFGSSLVFALPLLGQWLRPIFQALWHYQAFLNVLRFSISFLILLLPTTAMGLTLPVLLEDPLLYRRRFSRLIAAFYASNTLGAVVGAVVGEAYLIEKFGLSGTGLTAACFSLAAAAIAWFFAGTLHADGETSRVHVSLGKQIPWKLLALSLGTGAIFLGLELIWFRFMRLYVASTETAFCTMLAVVLSGIGLGGLAATAIGAPRKILPLLLLLAAMATLLSYIFFPVPVLQGDRKVFYIESWAEIAQLSVALMFPAAFLSGIMLPVMVSCIQEVVTNRMNSTGLTILFNTVGAAIGPILACFVLLPWLGFQSSLILSAIAYAALALLTCDKQTWSLRRPGGIALILLGLCFLLLLTLFPYRRNETHFENARRPFEADQSVLQKKIEGSADTFQVLRRDLFGEPYYYRLVTNAYSMSGTHPRSQRYMRLFAYLPLALRPQSENALLLCYGVGVTADAFTHDPRLKHLDIVDTSKEVFDLAGSYTGFEYSNPLRDSRVRTFVQDARFFLQAIPERYDVITGEPPPLKIAGTVNLYTQQFFELMHNRLKDGGIATFWLPISELTTNESKAILRAFHNVFANASVWATCDLEWIMMGSKGPLHRPDQGLVWEFWSEATMRYDLARIGIESPEQMSGLFVMDSDEIDRITDGVEPLSDFYPKRLSDAHPDLKAAYEFGHHYFETRRALRRFLSSSFIKESWPVEWQKSLDLFFLVREMRFRSEMSGSNWLDDLDLYLRHSQLRAPVLSVQNSDDFRLLLAEKFAERSHSMPVEALPDLIAGALARRDFPAAIQLLETEKDRGFSNVNDLFLLIYLYCLNGSVEKAEALASAEAGSIQKDWFVDWLWGELQAQFGFHPPG